LRHRRIHLSESEVCHAHNSSDRTVGGRVRVDRIRASGGQGRVRPARALHRREFRQRLGAKARAATLDDIQKYLERLGARYLPPDRTLTIEVRDIDLAGRYEPWRSGNFYDVRILRDVTWPRIVVRYTLTQGTATLLSREETVSDLNYLMRPKLRYSGDQLYYEKAMLDDWFRDRFVRNRPARG
jgi:hypothetical protein